MNEEEKFKRGVADFNAGRFFEAHEIWEELWLAAFEPEKTFLQGLIQIAAGFHHHGRGNGRGAQSLLMAGVAKLAECPDQFRGMAMADLRRETTEWVETAGDGNHREGRNLPLIHKSKV
jgi:uncharacterized protein